MSRHNRVVFVSTGCGASWGGSEELWSRAALALVAQGISVTASVTLWSPLHDRTLDLQSRGVEVWLRPRRYDVRQHPWRWLASKRNGPTVYDVEKTLAARLPALVVFSDGGPLPPIDLLELCVAKKLPFVTIVQATWERAWCTDDVAERYRAALADTMGCFFVSQGNLRMTEKHIGTAIPKAEVIWNPVNVPFDISVPWPPLGADGELRLANVGLLEPAHKGQDLLFEALARSPWQDRRWRLHLYGEGPMRQGLERLVQKLGLSDRVVFAGFAAIKDIWAANHALVMPSRHEGMPLAMIEAMLCARPVVATDVAGHAEIIEDGVTGFLADAPTPGAVAAALERFWERRHEAEEIGKAAERRIRQILPPDPVRDFAEKLKTLAGLSQ